MGKFNCKICGKEFERVGNGVYCSGPHYRPCPNCGKDVAYHVPSEQIRCCSAECVKQLSERSKSRNLGTRKCIECGKAFYPRQASQIYCDGPHFAVCTVCGSTFEYSCRPTERRLTCSSKCQVVERDNTHERNTGYRNPASDPITRKKISEAHHSEATILKTESTMLGRYNVTNLFRSKEFQDRQAVLQRDPDFQSHRYDSYSAKTGFAHPMCDPKVKERQAETRKAHGTYTQPASFFEKVNTDPTRCTSFLEFKRDPRSYILSHYDHKPSVFELANDLGVTDTPIYDILYSYDCKHLVHHKFSSKEAELYDKLLKSDPDLIMIRNDRNIIHPYEIDILIPAMKVGIELNPTYTHNVVGNHWGSGIDKYYHQYKSKLAEAHVFKCIHVFDWMDTDEVVKWILSFDKLRFSEFHEPELHFSKGTDVIQVVNPEDQHRLIEAGWLPVYDAGQSISLQ